MVGWVGGIPGWLCRMSLWLVPMVGLGVGADCFNVFLIVMNLCLWWATGLGGGFIRLALMFDPGNEAVGISAGAGRQGC